MSNFNALLNDPIVGGYAVIVNQESNNPEYNRKVAGIIEMIIPPEVDITKCNSF